MKAEACAKLNLTLYVGNKREDGFHSVSTVMQSVSLFDTVTVEKAEKITVECDGGVPGGRDNICFKAAELFFENAGIFGGARITVEKHIPSPGGLGGGSADAAAVLLLLNKLYGEPVSFDKLISSAAALGSDVPFCLVGGTAKVQGRGEKVKAVKPLPECTVLIAKKGEKLSTGEMYRLLDGDPDTVTDDGSFDMALRCGKLDDICRKMHNSFLRVAKTEDYRAAEKVMQKNGALGVLLCGSGPSVFGVFDNGNVKNAEKELESLGYKTFICIPTEKSVKIIE